jgi:hypothetical protein
LANTGKAEPAKSCELPAPDGELAPMTASTPAPPTITSKPVLIKMFMSLSDEDNSG